MGRTSTGKEHMNKEKFQYVLANWETKTNEEIARDLNVNLSAIYDWTAAYRKLGGPLPRKMSMRNSIKEQILKEIITEQGHEVLDGTVKQVEVTQE